MTPEAALIELLERVGANQNVVVLVTRHELSQWPSEAIKAMKSQKLITKARPATSTICQGCERDCVMPVNTVLGTSGESTSFIVCDKRDDINRVPVSIDQLTQWRCNANLVCGFVSDQLGLRRSKKQAANSGLWEIGIATGDKRSQMLCLQTGGELTLVTGNNTVPLLECISYQCDAYSLDANMIRILVDATTTADQRYTPVTAKREARKLDTQAMYKTWQKKYRQLKKKNPYMSDTWYSEQIAKLDIANGRSSGTIRKHMKV